MSAPRSSSCPIPDPEHIAWHPQKTQCQAESSPWRCTRIAGHTQTWHVCSDRRTGKTLKTWETT